MHSINLQSLLKSAEVKFSILPLSDTIYLFFLVFCLMVLDSSFGITRKYSLGATFQKLGFGAPLQITRTVVLFWSHGCNIDVSS